MYREVQLPRAFGNYELVRRIGRGGMAEVYEARRSGLHGVAARVAIKCILPHLTDDPRLVQMFINEAVLSVRLQHPNVVQVQEFNQAEGVYFLAMEYVDGCNLKDLIDQLHPRGETVPTALTVEILLQVLAGLSFAHTATHDDGSPMGIIHRDLKPANLFLTRQGGVKVGDFGIARAQSELYHTLGETGVRGTVGYMSPEQFQNRPLTPAADLFAVGSILFEMLSGQRLFSSPDLITVAMETVQLDVDRLVERVPESHLLFVPVLRRSLVRDPALRYQSADQFISDLEGLRAQLPPAPSLRVWLQPRLAEGSGSWSVEKKGESSPSPREIPGPRYSPVSQPPPGAVAPGGFESGRTPLPGASDPTPMGMPTPGLTALLGDKAGSSGGTAPARAISSRYALIGLVLLGVVGAWSWFVPSAVPLPTPGAPTPPDTPAVTLLVPTPAAPPSTPVVASTQPPGPSTPRVASPTRPSPRTPAQPPPPTPAAVVVVDPVTTAAAPALVTLNTIPFGAGRIQVDGGGSEKPPMVDRPLSPGDHVLLFTCQGGSSSEQRVNVVSGHRYQFVWDCLKGSWFRSGGTPTPATSQ